MSDPPSIEEIVKWGYDEEFHFAEQDEDLLLHSSEYVPVFIKLVNDPRCPKDYFSFSVLCEFTRDMFLNRNEKEIRDLKKVRDQTVKGKNSEYVKGWADYVERLYEYFYRLKPVDKVQAKNMAWDLLVGPSRVGNPSRPRLYGNVWEVKLKTSIDEYLCIDKDDGTWAYSMFYPCVGKLKRVFGWFKAPWDRFW